MEHFPQHPQKGVCNEIFTTKERCPPILNFVYCFTRFIIGGLILGYMPVCTCFKIMSKVVNIHVHVGYADIIIHMISWILDILLSFFRNFFFFGGGAKFKFAPGARYPRYATGSFLKVTARIRITKVTSRQTTRADI